jgi:acyl-coenzyme A synthetase/AMP-(fatty) acid ligase
MLDASETAGGVESWADFIDAGEAISDTLLDAVAAEVHESDPALIVYSSGTTSEPKGILHAQRAPAMQSWNMGHLFRRDESVRMWTPFPLFWTAGITTAMGGVFATGGCFVMQETFDPAEAIALIERERVTEPYYTRAHQAAAMEELPAWKDADFSAVAQVAPKEAFERHPTITRADPGWTQPTGFGMSETCAIFAGHPWHVPVSERHGSHGPLLPGNELRVLDVATREPLGPGEQGEIAIRGPVLMEHYVKKTREECFDTEGFLCTGDGGWFDEAGIVHWTGRLTDTIKTAGANVSPAEVELVLRKCEPLKAARIVGVPDEQRGEIVVLCATLKDGERISAEEIQAWCRERLASYKVPRRVLLLDDDEMPMTANQKIKDSALRELAEARLREDAPSAEGAR